MRERRTVTLCKHTLPVKGRGNAPKLWAFSIKDLASLFGTSESIVKLWVNGRNRRSEGRPSTKPILDPGDLKEVVLIFEKRRKGLL